MFNFPLLPSLAVSEYLCVWFQYVNWINILCVLIYQTLEKIIRGRNYVYPSLVDHTEYALGVSPQFRDYFLYKIRC